MRTTWRIDWINWPVNSQAQSRRNARHALLVLEQRRREREGVEQYLAALPRQRRPAV